MTTLVLSILLKPAQKERLGNTLDTKKRFHFVECYDDGTWKIENSDTIREYLLKHGPFIQDEKIITGEDVG